ncbi:MAG: hypothetical protein U1E97_01840 [Alphaproteobacteria bacterium]
MTSMIRPPLREALAIAIGGLAVAAAIRYLAIESDTVARICTAMGEQPWWCTVHRGTVITFQSGILGIASLASGVISILGGRILGGRRFFVLAATGLGAAGLVLYSAGPAAVALVLGLLRAVRR